MGSPVLIFVCRNLSMDGQEAELSIDTYKDVHIFLTGKKLQTAQSRSRIFIPNRQYNGSLTAAFIAWV